LRATALDSIPLRRSVNIRVENQPHNLLGRFRLNKSDTQLVKYAIVILAIESYKGRLRLVDQSDKLDNSVKIARTLHEQKEITLTRR
jgi:hypothetical protein